VASQELRDLGLGRSARAPVGLGQLKGSMGSRGVRRGTVVGRGGLKEDCGSGGSTWCALPEGFSVPGN
jgi:hypothetical protein